MAASESTIPPVLAQPERNPQFAIYAPTWLESRKPFLSVRTFRDYGYYIGRLSRFFGDKHLLEIDCEHLRAYQRARMSTAGGDCINKELAVLIQMLNRFGCWERMAPDYQALPTSKRKPGKALSKQEQEKFWRVAASKPLWRVAFRCAQLMANTSMGPGEVRGLQLQDVDLAQKTLSVREHAKNQFRVRRIPLNDLACECAEELLERAHKLGASLPQHYLIPYRVQWNLYDLSRPGSETFMRTAFRQMGKAAELHFRIYDLRHTAITNMCEDPEVSEETIRSVAGHVSREMLEWYCHTRTFLATAW